MGKDGDFFQKSCDELKRNVEKENTKNFFDKKRFSQQEANDSLKMIGYNQTISITEQFQIKPVNTQINNVNDLPEKK